MSNPDVRADERGRCDVIMPQTPGNLDPTDLIREACARNLAADIQFTDADHRMHAARCRMLVATADEIFLDEPHAIGDELSLRVGTAITAYFMLNDVRYAFETTVTRRHVPIMLNRRRRVVGIVVRAPQQVVQSQRRSDFRVTMLYRTPLAARVHVATPGTDTTPLDARVLDGMIVNMSAGGLALVVPAAEGRGISVGDELFVSFVVPAEDEEPDEHYEFRAQVRQVRPISEGISLRFGLQFLPWPEARFLQRMQDRLRRLLSRAEREKLRRAS